jgi:hypothetical protein
MIPVPAAAVKNTRNAADDKKGKRRRVFVKY